MKIDLSRKKKRISHLVGAALLAAALIFASSCAHTTENREWKPGDTVVCPHCGRPFSLPEKTR